MATSPEHVLTNRQYWDDMAHDWVSAGERSWASDVSFWGIWGLPDATVSLLPADMSGMTAIELGCGTGYVSGWMIRRGAQAIGLDNSMNQLRTAQRLASDHNVTLPLIHGNAETVPLPDASFDYAVSEYGAAIWCDPLKWIPEAYRLLKPGGQLAFLGTHPLAIVTTPPSGDVSETTLHRAWFDLYLQDWRDVEIDPGGMEFNLSFERWLRLFRDTGFEVVDYRELQAQPGRDDTKFAVTGEWAQRWPSEQVWVVRKPA